MRLRTPHTSQQITVARSLARMCRNPHAALIHRMAQGESAPVTGVANPMRYGPPRAALRFSARARVVRRGAEVRGIARESASMPYRPR